MRTIRKIKEMREAIYDARAAIQGKRATVGFVPTMGFLHDGHVSLMKRAKSEADIVVLSIFVNPLQFGPNEDFERYPRDEARDLAVAEGAGVDFVFMPDVPEMYPTPMQTNISVSGLTERLCGASRPGHFDGVATVVTKLFQIVQPDKAFFGLKDAQQVAVVKQMTEDLNMPVEIVPCDILREPDGLAMSSRNVYLTAAQRREALVLSQSLNDVRHKLEAGQAEAPETLIAGMKQRILQAAPESVIDYIEILAYPGLTPIVSVEQLKGGQAVIVALAVKFGSTRLIDNIIVNAGGEKRNV